MLPATHRDVRGKAGNPKQKTKKRLSKQRVILAR